MKQGKEARLQLWAPGTQIPGEQETSRTPLPVHSNKGKGPAVFIYRLWPVSEWLLWGQDDQITLCMGQVTVADKTASGSEAGRWWHQVRMQKGIRKMCMGHEQCPPHWILTMGNGFTSSIPTKRLELKSLLVFSPKRFFSTSSQST